MWNNEWYTRYSNQTEPVKLVTRKIKFEMHSTTNAGFIIATANQIAKEHGGYVKRYKIKNCISTSVIVFKCAKDKWYKINFDFVSRTNGLISEIRSSI